MRSVSVVKTRGPRKQAKGERLILGRYIVADPTVCHGKVTFKGTRIFVTDVLVDIERGLSWDFIIERWGSKISRDALAEAVHLSRNALLSSDGTLSASATHLARLREAA